MAEISGDRSSAYVVPTPYLLALDAQFLESA
jgi:hypothetical protein